MGPPVPLWFKRRLKSLDPRLRLQFIPPQSAREPRGVPRDAFPRGVWDICRVLRKSGRLHPVAVWSLVDRHGNYAAPGMDTIRLLRLAYYLHRRNQLHLLERQMDDSIQEMNQAACVRSSGRLRNAMGRYMSLYGSRQWQNRVYLRRDIGDPRTGTQKSRGPRSKGRKVGGDTGQRNYPAASPEPAVLSGVA